MLRFASSDGSARFAFTDRHGGGSKPPFNELNLGGHVGDDPAVVAANRRLVADAIGRPVERVLYMNQIHSADVVVVDRPWEGSVPPADAVVTTRGDLALAVLVADCVPVLLADVSDPAAPVIAAAHAGRPGVAAGVIPSVVGVMRDLGARTLSARVGPAVCGACYEVPDDLRADVAEVVPETWATTRQGSAALDLRAGVRAQLLAAGVEFIDDAGACTLESPELYSYRRDHNTGRFAGVVWVDG